MAWKPAPKYTFSLYLPEERLSDLSHVKVLAQQAWGGLVALSPRFNPESKGTERGKSSEFASCLTTFHLFPRLPVEMQDAVWRMATTETVEPIILETCYWPYSEYMSECLLAANLPSRMRNNALYSTCRASRAIALRTWGDPHRSEISFHPANDVVGIGIRYSLSSRTRHARHLALFELHGGIPGRHDTVQILGCRGSNWIYGARTWLWTKFDQVACSAGTDTGDARKGEIWRLEKGHSCQAHERIRYTTAAECTKYLGISSTKFRLQRLARNVCIDIGFLNFDTIPRNHNVILNPQKLSCAEWFASEVCRLLRGFPAVERVIILIQPSITCPEDALSRPGVEHSPLDSLPTAKAPSMPPWFPEFLAELIGQVPTSTSKEEALPKSVKHLEFCSG